ncbi:MAG: DNA-directed RNA polymerase subunit omega [Thermoanaerobaculales bacterium]|jgi:DNA-directed RNA polymerase subunit K/omega|nr:DNA-directed RNA polymerase subunit omega [Thermoanaerobaculales bacterium]
MIQLPEGFDSIFRYIVVVSQRAEQLVNGAKARSESKHDKATLVALDDVDDGQVEWRILTQEELDAQRQAIVDQLRAEVGVDEAEGVEGAEIPDVLPTAETEGAAPAAGDDEVERDDELARLQKLLGMTAAPAAEAKDESEAESPAEEPVTIDLEEAAEELEGSADDEDDEES